MAETFNADFILGSFDFPGRFVSSEVKTDGIINSTFLLCFDADGVQEKFILQKINTFVFRKPDELMQNIAGVTAHIREKGEMQTLDFLKTKDGSYYCTDSEGNCWRCYKFVDGVYTCNRIDSKEVFYNAGRAFGKFQRLLCDYPIKTLYDTIPDFHNTPKRLEAFKEALAKDTEGRAASVKDEIDYILRNEDKAYILTNLCKEGKIPLRVTHNDTKLNNILFDEKTDEGVCIIDLDTVMPGLSLYDYGDSIRFGANTAAEDEPDTRKVSLDLELFRAYTEGYLSEAKDSLTPAEAEHLAFSAYLMTFELVIRFLTDYLNGDVYFKTGYPQHNLVRTRAQIALCKDIDSKLTEMKKIVKEYCHA